MSISGAFGQLFVRHSHFFQKNMPNYLTVFCLLLIYTQDLFGIKGLTDEISSTTLVWCLLTPGLLIFFSLFLSKNNRLRLLGSAVICTTLITEIDKLYFYFFQSLPSISNAKAMGQIWDVHYSLYLLINPMTFIPVLFGIFVFIYPFLVTKYLGHLPGKSIYSDMPTRSSSQFSSNYFVLAFASCSLFSLFILSPWQVSIAKSNHDSNMTSNIETNAVNNIENNQWASEHSSVYYAADHGIIGYHYNDISDFLSKIIDPPEISAQRKQQIDKLLTQKQNLNKISTEMFGLAKGRNIVFLQMESWAEYLIDLKINGEEVTPTTNLLKQNSLYFNNIYDVTLHGRTSDAEFAVFTGLLPDARKPAQMSHMDSYFQSLPRLLQQYGYTSTAIHGHDKDFWNISNAHDKYGFSNSYFDESFAGVDKLGLGVNDKDVFEFSANKFSESENQKFLGLTISLTSHHPFIDIPEAYKTLFPELRRGEGYGLLPYFLKSVRYSDDAVKRFFEVAKQQAYFYNTVFVIYGDHDPGVLNNKRTVNGLNLTAVENDKVPVLIYIPGKEKELKNFQKKIANVSGGLHDVMPTVLHLLGLEIPYGVLGTHLFVSNDLRQAIPLPQSPLYAVKDNSVYKGEKSKKSDEINFRQVFNEQLSVQEILDYRLLKDVADF